jgi:hypothetical protein
LDILPAVLSQRQDEFIQHFSRKLLGDALGRAVQIGDRSLFARIRRRMNHEGPCFSVLVDGIVRSPQVRMARTDRAR